MVKALGKCFSGSWLAEGNTPVSSGLSPRQWRLLPDHSADPRVCVWGEEGAWCSDTVYIWRYNLLITPPTAGQGGTSGACFVTVLSEQCLWCRHTKSLAPWRGRPETPEVIKMPTGFHHKYRPWGGWQSVTQLSFMSLSWKLITVTFDQFMPEPFCPSLILFICCLDNTRCSMSH